MLTCNETRALMKKGYVVCTGAERVAVMRHIRSCVPCERRLVLAGVTAIKNLKLSKEQLQEIERYVERTYERDLADSENGPNT